MDSNEGTSYRVESVEELPTFIKPIIVHRRIRADMIDKARIRYMTPNNLVVPAHLSMLIPEIKTKVNPKAYEYHVAGIGWMSDKVYRAFKRRCFKEDW